MEVKMALEGENLTLILPNFWGCISLVSLFLRKNLKPNEIETEEWQTN
jgi:hypothetical protein